MTDVADIAVLAPCAGCGVQTPPDKLVQVQVGNLLLRECATCVGKIRWNIQQQLAAEKHDDEARKKVDRFFVSLARKAKSDSTPRTHVRDVMEAAVKRLNGADAVGGMLADALTRLEADGKCTTGFATAMLGFTKLIGAQTAIEAQTEQADHALWSDDDLRQQLIALVNYAETTQPALPAPEQHDAA